MLGSFWNIHQGTHNKSGFRCILGQCRNVTFFESTELLRVHQNDAQAHPALVNKICHICDKKFTENSVYVKHIKSHNVELEKNFACDDCDKKFFHPSELKLHVRQSHTKRFRCTQCDFGTYTNRTLERHMLVHMEKNSFTIMCQMCGTGFKHNDYLVRHMATHSDARPHACSTCGKTFKLKKHLNIHMKIHTNEYSITCNICERPFVQRYNLKQHMKKHHPNHPNILKNFWRVPLLRSDTIWCCREYPRLQVRSFSNLSRLSCGTSAASAYRTKMFGTSGDLEREDC